MEYDLARYSQMSHCSRVNRRWRPLAQKILFSEVALYSGPPAQSFLEAIRANPALGQATKLLDLYISDYSFMIRNPILPQKVYDITSLCPRLYQLKLQIRNVVEGEALRTLLHPQTFGTLQALSLNVTGALSLNVTGSTMPEIGFFMRRMDIQDVIQFLHRFRALSHLQLGNLGRLPPRGRLQLPESPSYKLLELEWYHAHVPGIEVHINYFPDLVGWLFPEPSENVRILSFHDDGTYFDQDNLHLFLRNHGKNPSSSSYRNLSNDPAVQPP
ncbi:hypothetical protein FRC02_001424 [Tulasnella sp. 418]|nr:hypothetical protein FRC02_001424 [Tulasnella sp. 418]